MLNGHLLNLLQLTDPTLPLGAYAHSSGLETYIQKRIIRDIESARIFITNMLEQNLCYTDAAFLSLSYNAAETDDWERIIQLDQECNAAKMPEELRKASQQLATRLLKVFQPLCGSAISLKYKDGIHNKEVSGHYSIAFGLYAFAMNLPKREALTGFFYNAAVGIVTNCVKLIPLGQQAGQELLFSLQVLINKVVETSMEPDINMVGRACPGFDIRCMQHEQLYSRLYMS